MVVMKWSERNHSKMALVIHTMGEVMVGPEMLRSVLFLQGIYLSSAMLGIILLRRACSVVALQHIIKSRCSSLANHVADLFAVHSLRSLTRLEVIGDRKSVV